MADKREKKGYQGQRLKGDTVLQRAADEIRKKRAAKNAQGAPMTNDAYALDTEFQTICADADVKPTRRQASKFRNGYGKAARSVGKNTRRDPEAR